MRNDGQGFNEAVASNIHTISTDLPAGVYNGKLVDVTIQEKLSFEVLISFQDNLGRIGSKLITEATMSTAIASYCNPSYYFLLPMLNSRVKVRKSDVINEDDVGSKWEIVSLSYSEPNSENTLRGSKERPKVGDYEGDLITDKKVFYDEAADSTENFDFDSKFNLLPKDLLPGDFGYVTGDSGVKVLSGGMSVLRASIVSQMMCLKEDDLVRIISKNFEHMKGSGMSSSLIQSNGEILEEDKIAFTFGDALEQKYHLEIKKGKNTEEEFDGLHLSLNKIEGDKTTTITNIQLNSDGTNHVKTQKELIMAFQHDIKDSDSKKALIQLGEDGIYLETDAPMTAISEEMVISTTKEDLEFSSARNVILGAEHSVKFNATEGFDLSSEAALVLNSEDQLSVTSATKIIINSSGEIEIISDKDILIKTPKNVNVDAGQNFNVKCSKMKIT